MRNLFLILILLVGVAAAAPKLQSLAGTFQGVEVGDYVHLNVKDAKGKPRSFWLTKDPSFTPFVEHPEKFKGKKVVLTWHQVTRNIPEAGGKLTVDEATSIKLAP